MTLILPKTRNIKPGAGVVVAALRSYSVILEPPEEEGGFSVLVPALPEVVTEGDTEAEALANAEEAIGAALAYRRDSGLPIPADARPQVRQVRVATAA